MRLVVLFSALFALLLLVACGNQTTAPAGAGVKTTNLIGRGLPKTKPDPLVKRRIVLLHPHSGERLDRVYYKNGSYQPEAMAAINHLMRDRTANVVGEIDPELIDFLVDIRTRLSLPPDVVFEILSGYRTRETNTLLSFHNKNVAKESFHIHGWAVDFRVPAVNGSAIAEIAKTMQRGGVSFYPRDNHVHVDLGNIRTWPTGGK